MKTKTDLYTKVVLTVIAIFLGILIFKDVDFVTKAQASPLDLSALNIEKADDDEGMVFYIYDISNLDIPFETKKYRMDQFPPYNSIERWKEKEKSPDEAYLDNNKHLPKYIITNKKGSFWLEK